MDKLKSKNISDYALLGNGLTAALINKEGCIEWVCFPHFDSCAYFSSLLGNRDHGQWSLNIEEIESVERQYEEGTSILKSIYRCSEGVLECIDFMPLNSSINAIFRKIKVLEGNVKMGPVLSIKSDYGLNPPLSILCNSNNTATITFKDCFFFFNSSFPIEVNDVHIINSVELAKGDEGFFQLVFNSMNENLDFLENYQHTKEAWQEDILKYTYEGQYTELVQRSAIVLKSLFFRPTGAMIAAPTTSLPESLEGMRNWDYRYCWLRDSVLTVNAFTKLGDRKSAKKFFNWALQSIVDNNCNLQVGFTINGKKVNEEKELNHLPGFNNYSPVRIGNLGLNQYQLDVYGEFVICLHHCWEHDLIDVEINLATLLENFLMQIIEKYQVPDRGIWEVRAGPAFYTYSQAMAYMGIEKGVDLYQKIGGKRLNLQMIKDHQNSIYNQILTKGVDPQKNYFTQKFNSSFLDASNLSLPIMGFIDINHPIMRATIDLTIENLLRDGLVYRYKNDDGFEEKEGAFIACSFWLVECLSMQNRHKEVKSIFHQAIKYCSDLSLFSEEADPDSKTMLGNFPQAFSHLAIINAAFSLDQKEQ